MEVYSEISGIGLRGDSSCFFCIIAKYVLRNLDLKNYVEWRVSQVMPVRSGFGYRIFLKYLDGSEKPYQKSGFKTEKEANKAREKTIAELYNGTFIVYSNVKVAEFMLSWLEIDIGKRTESRETYYNYCNTVNNHVIPALGNKRMADVTRGDIQKLFNAKASYSRSVAEQVKTIMNVSFRYAVTSKVISVSPVEGVGLPKTETSQKKTAFRSRSIDTQKTLTMEQVLVLLEKSKDTPIHMQVLFGVLMGLRRSEINGVKYSDIDYINRTLHVNRQLGRIHNAKKEDFAPKTFTKQEYYKQLLAESGLPDIRWHDLRSTYCTLLLKEEFNPKAVSKLMGHAKELITMDVYADNREIIADGVLEIERDMEMVLPNMEENELFKNELLEIVVDVTKFLPEIA